MTSSKHPPPRAASSSSRAAQAPAQQRTIAVPEPLRGARADRGLATILDVSVNAARRLIEAGRVRVNGKRVKKGDALGTDAVVVFGHGSWFVPGPPVVAVLYEDAALLIVDKPAGMPCHPMMPGEGGTVVDALVARYPELPKAVPPSEVREAGLVHRLDTGTSGCLAVARDRKTWDGWRAAFSDDEHETIEKRYLALVVGVVGAVGETVTIREPILKDPRDPRRMIIHKDGRPGLTSAITLASSLPVSSRSKGASLVLVMLHGGGRRHQIRVSLAARGHPLVGDTLYGGPADGAWPWLHAVSLKLPGKPLVTAPVPVPFIEAARTRGLTLPASGI